MFAAISAGQKSVTKLEDDLENDQKQQNMRFEFHKTCMKKQLHDPFQTNNKQFLNTRKDVRLRRLFLRPRRCQQSGVSAGVCSGEFCECSSWDSKHRRTDGCCCETTCVSSDQTSSLNIYRIQDTRTASLLENTEKYVNIQKAGGIIDSSVL